VSYQLVWVVVLNKFCFSLLQTVPSDVLSKGKVIADSYLDREDVVETESPDPDLKQLESILWIANMHTVNIMCIKIK
jgi:hypothetical protein